MNVREISEVERTFDQIVVQIDAEINKAEKLEEWVCIENCKYSYNELLEYKSYIKPYFSESGIFGAGIDDGLNKVNIYAIEGTDLSILSDLIPEDAVNIKLFGEDGEKAELEDLASYTAYCGSGLVNDSKGSTATLSCSVVWDRSTSEPKYGYLTAGHFASNVGDVIGLIVQSNGGYVYLGNVVKTKRTEKIDAALIEKANSSGTTINSTSSTKYGTSYKYCGGVPGMNQPVTAYGYVSGVLSGTVMDTSFSNASVENMVLTSLPGQAGDSGAPVIAPITTNELSLTGIVKGRMVVMNMDIGLLYVKMRTIMDEWDLNGLQ